MSSQNKTVFTHSYMETSLLNYFSLCALSLPRFLKFFLCFTHCMSLLSFSFFFFLRKVNSFLDAFCMFAPVFCLISLLLVLFFFHFRSALSFFPCVFRCFKYIEPMYFPTTSPVLYGCLPFHSAASSLSQVLAMVTYIRNWWQVQQHHCQLWSRDFFNYLFQIFFFLKESVHGFVFSYAVTGFFLSSLRCGG